MRRSDSAMDTTKLPSVHTKGGTDNPPNALDICVLGVCTGNGLNELDFALLRYHQDAPDAQLRVDLIKVRMTGSISSTYADAFTV